MKKTICAVLAGIMLSVLSIPAIAANSTTISIDSAKYSKDSDSVAISGKIENYSEGQNITIMATGIIDNEQYNPDEILFIDQQDASIDANGNYNVTFKLSEIAVEGTRYLARVGGTGISEPAPMAFLFGESGTEPTILYGDINNDGIVDTQDAADLLTYVLNPSDFSFTDKGLENAQIEKEAIENFTAKHASLILQKALKGDKFKLPVEEK